MPLVGRHRKASFRKGGWIEELDRRRPESTLVVEPAPPTRPACLLSQGPCHNMGKEFSPGGRPPGAGRARTFLQSTRNVFPIQSTHWRNGLEKMMKLARLFLLFALVLMALSRPAAADAFPPITEAERVLVSVPDEPNAPAVVLFKKSEFLMMGYGARGEVSSRLLVQERRKILTEQG